MEAEISVTLLRAARRTAAEWAFVISWFNELRQDFDGQQVCHDSKAVGLIWAPMVFNEKPHRRG